ncbi:MAG TPA: hypothetical protein VFC06_00445 [Demequina sp.]|nr:hypothetical protein [Demequina sp.]
MKAEIEDTIAYQGTCDAGDCEAETLAVVLTPDGWTAMCAEHAVIEARGAILSESMNGHS